MPGELLRISRMEAVEIEMSAQIEAMESERSKLQDQRHALSMRPDYEPQDLRALNRRIGSITAKIEAARKARR